MPGPDFVSRSKKECRFSRKVCLLLGSRPFWIRRRYKVDRWQTFFVRARNYNVSDDPPLIRRRFVHLSLFGSGDRNKLFIGYEGFQLLELCACGLDRTAPRLISHLFRSAIGECLAWGKLGTCILQRCKIPLQILAADHFELIERDVHTLGSVQHLMEKFRAEGEIFICSGSLRREPRV